MREDIDIEYFAHRLKKRRSSILAAQDQKNNENAPKELDQSRIGRLSRMDAMQQQAMSQATARLAGLELIRIKTALERLKEGEYGYCIICDEEIAIKRLEFDPSLLSCVECAEKAEKDE